MERGSGDPGVGDLCDSLGAPAVRQLSSLVMRYSSISSRRGASGRSKHMPSAVSGKGVVMCTW